jgi:hypothetical protein
MDAQGLLDLLQAYRDLGLDGGGGAAAAGAPALTLHNRRDWNITQDPAAYQVQQQTGVLRFSNRSTNDDRILGGWRIPLPLDFQERSVFVRRPNQYLVSMHFVFVRRPNRYLVGMHFVFVCRPNRYLVGMHFVFVRRPN